MPNPTKDMNKSRQDLTVAALLEDDHQRIDQMFQDVLDALINKKPPKSQKLLFKLFKSALLRHLHWEARARCSSEIRMVQDGESITTAGWYEDSFRRIDWEWKFLERRFNGFHMVPLSKGWAS